MQISNKSNYCISEDALLEYLASDVSEEKIRNSDWISTDGKKDRKEIFSCDSTSEEEMNN